MAPRLKLLTRVRERSVRRKNAHEISHRTSGFPIRPMLVNLQELRAIQRIIALLRLMP